MDLLLLVCPLSNAPELLTSVFKPAVVGLLACRLISRLVIGNNDKQEVNAPLSRALGDCR